MSKKNKPLIDNAQKSTDEPQFVLLGRDPQAADLVRLWAEGRDFLQGADDPQVGAARKCADAMSRWCAQHDCQPVGALTLLPFELLARELRRRGAKVIAAGCDKPLDEGDDADF